MSMEMMSGKAILNMSFLTGMTPILFSFDMELTGMITSARVILHKYKYKV